MKINLKKTILITPIAWLLFVILFTSFQHEEPKNNEYYYKKITSVKTMPDFLDFYLLSKHIQKTIKIKG